MVELAGVVITICNENTVQSSIVKESPQRVPEKKKYVIRNL